MRINVSDSIHITICFSKSMDSLSLTNIKSYVVDSGIGNPISVSVTTNCKCVNLTLANKLINRRIYTISFSTVNDCEGNSINPTNFHFSYYIPAINDVVINEIMCDPMPSEGLPDYEYIELYNKAIFPIDLSGWTFSSSSHKKTMPAIVILPDSFIVLTGSAGYQAYVGLGLPVYEVKGFPVLSNSGAVLTLRNEKGQVMNAVNYSDSWYNDPYKSQGGFSLEMVDPKYSCIGENNWKASNDSKGGTPGKVNSVHGVNPGNTLSSLLRISVISSDSIELYFSESMDSLTLIQKSVYSIDNGIGEPIVAIPVSPFFNSVKLKLPAPLQNNTIYSCNVNNLDNCLGNSLGTENSCRFSIPEPPLKNEVVINEIMFDPWDGGVKWLEIVNSSSKTIDISKLLIGKFDTVQQVTINPAVIFEQGFLMFPGQYIVISPNGSEIKQQYFTTNPNGFIDISSLPTLHNEGALCLSDKNENVIDHIKYSSSMHSPLLNSTKGISLERIN
ncbi:MAG TPA: lamin tail domain-containing protein, partial [Nitrosopumilaceae archaeon]|nr:lamin tail domain-containing protein [Nitrosopumilaceae archaeon]